MPIHRLDDYRSSPGPSQGQNPEQPLTGGIPSPQEMYPPISHFLAPSFDMKTFIFFISVIQMIYFIAELVVGHLFFSGAFVIGNNMAGPGADTLKAMGAKYGPAIWEGQVFRFWTPALMHGGILHIFMNGVFQFMLCFKYEETWGTSLIIFQYFFGAMGSVLLTCCTNPMGISVGASGALFAMIGCHVSWLIMNWNNVHNPRHRMCNVVMILVINIIIGFGWTAGNIDNTAHFGGLITGMLMGLAFCPSTCTFTSERWAGKEQLMKRIGLFLSLCWFGIMLMLFFFVVKRN